MMFGEFMLGARSRLLPPSVPFGFFGAAVAYHLVAWGILAAGGDSLPGFMGGPGFPVAALHLITLGVLAMTAMGASYQLLPVATKRPVASVAACRVSFWLFAPGVAVLAHGLAWAQQIALHAGGTLVVAGLAVYLVLLADNLRRVDDMPVVTRHAWAAALSLLLLAALGLLLVVDMTSGLLPDRMAVAAAHAVLAGYGFMGMLALGFSYILIPMFTLSRLPESRLPEVSILFGAAGLVLGAAGTLLAMPPLVLAAVACGLGAAAAYLRVMAQVMKARMKRDLGGSFVLIRVSWAMLPVSLLAGGALALGWQPHVTAPLWGFLLVYGWLLTFLLGVLQRIMPFLASMHSVRPGVPPVLVSALTADPPLRVHLFAHMAALVLVGAGILLGQGWLVQVGAAFGLAAGVAFAVFAVLLWRRLALHLNNAKTGRQTP